MQVLNLLVKDNVTSLQLQVALLNLYSQLKAANAEREPEWEPLFEAELAKIDQLLYPDLVDRVIPPEVPHLQVARYEKRLRPLWVENAKWHAWETCTDVEYSNILKLTNQDKRIIQGNWEFQVRRLFTNSYETQEQR